MFQHSKRLPNYYIVGGQREYQNEHEAFATRSATNLWLDIEMDDRCPGLLTEIGHKTTKQE